MTDNPFGSPTTPSSSSPYPELRYDGEGRPVGGNPYAMPSGGHSGYGVPAPAGGQPGADPFAPGQYVPGQYSQGPYGQGSYAPGTTDPYASPAANPGAQGYATPGYSPDYSQGYGSQGFQPAYAAQAYQQRPDQTMLIVSWIVAILTSLYMLPWAIAVTRRRPDTTAIALVTLFTGWTFVGWVVGLVWSLKGVSQPQLPPPGWYPSPTGVGQQYWDGYAWTGHTQP